MLKLAFSNWAVKILSSLLNLGALIVLSRNLGPQGRGVCAVYTVIIALATIFNEMAPGSTVVYLQQKVSWKQLRQLAFYWSILISGIISFLLFVRGTYELKACILIWFISFVSAIVNIQSNILIGFQQFRWYNLLTCATPLFILVGLVVAALLRVSTPHNYLTIVASANVMVAVLGYYRLLWLRPKEAERLRVRPLLNSVLKTGFLNQMGHLVSLLNNRFVYSLFPATSLGNFTNAQSLAESMLLVPGSMGQIYYARTAGNRMGPTVNNQLLFYRLIWLNMAIMILGLLCIVLIPGSFYTWVFGPEFKDVKSLILYTGAASAIYSIYLLFSYWQSARGKFVLNLLALLSGSAVIILGLLFGGNYLHPNMQFLLWLIIASMTVISLVAIFLFKREVNQEPQ